MTNTIAQAYLRELQAEEKATRACLERIPENVFEYKPHPKSMKLGYLALLVAEIPLWVKHMVTDSEIDFVTFKHATPDTTAALLAHFDENMQAAASALQSVSDADLQALFSLKAAGQLLYTSAKGKDIGVTLNHWVHHRGQLTVYMRMNDIAVPSLYGPSADDRTFAAPE